LPPGTYTITVSSAGFQSYVETEIAVMPKTIRRVDVTLTVGQVTENLTVEASVAALQTDRAEIRSEVTGAVYDRPRFFVQSLIYRDNAERNVGKTSGHGM